MPGTIQSLTKYPDCVSDRRGLQRLHISQHRVLAGVGEGWGRDGGGATAWGDTGENWRIMSHQNTMPDSH